MLAAACRPSAPASEAGSALLADQSRTQLTDEQLRAISESTAARVSRALADNAALADAPAPACDAAVPYAHALLIAGRVSECLTYTRGCAATGSAALSLVEARCAHVALDLDGAHAAYDRALRAAEDASQPTTGLAVSFAHFALSTQYAGDVDGILARASGLSQQDRDSYRALLDYLVTSKLTGTTRDQLEAFVESRLAAKPDGALADLLRTTWLVSLVSQQYRYADGLAFARDRAAGWGLPFAAGLDPSRWLAAVYSALYVMPGRGFEWARAVYDAYAPYATAISTLPTEQNTYTYTELYASACRDTLLPPAGLSALQGIARQWKAGTLATTDAASRARALLDVHGRRRADVLAFLGGMSEALGDDTAATAYFLEAHAACRYYNRSHWGLVSVRRRATWSAFADYQSQLDRIERTLAGVRFPASLPRYVLNYGSLNEGERDRFKYAMRYWAPHIDRLVGWSQKLYVKRGFELLSEVPGLESIRDVRIDYPHDQRLWDDVRGLGGNPVVADMGETAGSAFGAYNLAAHEVAHQFHQQAPRVLVRCIESLYRAAKARGVFPDPYAATNEWEYFAQGVTYYNVPADSPARFGVNRSWMDDNDPDLLAFVIAIERVGAGDLSGVGCPIALDDEESLPSAAPRHELRSLDLEIQRGLL